MSRIKELLPYFYVLISFVSTLILVVILFDKLLFPLLIKGSDEIKMPNLIGRNISDAEQVLDNLGLRLAQINQVYSEQYGEGTVINQVPRPNQIIRKGRDVFLTVSKGAVRVEVPNLIGENIRNARFIIKNNGLEVGSVQYINHPEIGPDTIITQSPEPKALVVYGKQVNLIVSLGPAEQIKVPFVEGLKLEDAIRMLQESELDVGEIRYVENQTYLPNTVLKQGIAAGELVRKGIRVDLTVVK